jgi:two-component system CheB/CheR fusion protein
VGRVRIHLDADLSVFSNYAPKLSGGDVSGVGVLPIAAKGLSPDRLGQLALAVSALLNAETRDDVIEIVRSSARRLCGASGIAIILREGELCHYIAEDSETPLWAGQRFPASHCISGWSMIHRQQAVITDVYEDPRLPHEAYRPTGVQSLVMTPVGRPRPVAALGAYWTKRHEPSADETASLEAIAESMGAALNAISTREDLQTRLEESERRRRDLESRRSTAGCEPKRSAGRSPCSAPGRPRPTRWRTCGAS